MPCSPRMSACKASCLHRQTVLNYRLARINDESQADTASIGYATERAEYLEAHPSITFKQWLIGHRTPAEAVEL